jgi:hypothetical protein
MNDERMLHSLDDTGRHPLYQVHESRRGYPRVKLRMPVQIGLAGGRVVIARIYNMSPDGVQIRCDRATAASILPDTSRLKPGEGPELLLVMRLTLGQDTRSHVIRCRLSYALPESAAEVIMGLTFQELLPAQREAIDAALGASLEPRD